ncbi:hypothetical protein HY484_03700 [Candidatus Woesearchaeota archaeon]|nr:hypothetical protein [Candidatus Woesearchaeota archaeon]
MQTTINGTYPRVSSDTADKLRKELNKNYNNQSNPAIIAQLQEELTKEIVQEQINAGIDIPNDGLVYAYDEISWPLEEAEGIEFGGMKKTLHTNIHHREIKCTGQIKPKDCINQLHTLAKRQRDVKLELPGPYTLAVHTKLQETSPYKNIEQLAHAYAEFYQTTIRARKDISLIQFNEPSIIAYKREHPNLEIISEVYADMLKGVKAKTIVWTYGGIYDRKTIDILFELPVDTIGFDFVWDLNVEKLLKKISTDKNIGFGIIDSGDTGWIGEEDKQKIVKTLKSFAGYTYLSKALIAPNTTLEHLQRTNAREKLRTLREICNEVNK